ncbi:hypothetical protein BGZ72_001290, partial [Mortierella alpina]
MTLEHGTFRYTIVARIRRKFPRTDLIKERHVWVINSGIPSPNSALQGITLGSLPGSQSPISLPQKLDPSTKVSGVSTSCDLPATAFWAGERIPLMIKATYATMNLCDNASVFSNESRAGLLPDWITKSSDKNGELNLESGLPTISVRLKQTIIYKHKRDTTVPERSNYAVRFHLNQSAIATQNGWSIGFYVTLPNMSEQSARNVSQVPSKAGPSKIEHTAVGLKPSLECSAVTVKHSLKIRLEYKAKGSSKPLVFKHS